MRRARAARTRPAQQLAEHLHRVIGDAEAELAQLGCHPQAWQEVRAHLSGTMPLFGFGGTAELLLGPMASKKSAGSIPTRALPAFRAIERQARRCKRCRAAIEEVPDRLVGHVMVEQAREHHKALFRRYEVETKKPPPPAIQEMPAWSAAYRAATATTALRNLASPMALFAAGAYLEQQRLLAWTTQTLLPQAKAHARRRFTEGVARGRFPRLEELAVGRARSKTAKQQQVERAKALEPVWEGVCREHQELCAAGYSVTQAARTIATDPRIRAKIQEISQRAGIKPWHGEFYSFAAIRKIVGL